MKTVLEWLESATRYTFETKTFEKIALDRGCEPDEEVYETTTQRERDLMEADIIFTAVLLSPSNTASLSQSHNGYQKTIGQEQDTYRNDKIKYAIAIYNKYGDDKAALLAAAQKKIRFVPIKDKIL